MISKRLLKNPFWSDARTILLGFFLIGYSSMTLSEEVSNFQVFSKELESGMKIYLKEDHSAPLVALALTVGVGTRTEGPWLGTGISHLMEHLLFEGSHQAASSEMGQKIERHGGEINAYTTPDFTLYYISIPKDSVQVALDVLFECVREPSFDSSNLEREKQVIFHEIQMGEDDPDRVLHKFFWKTAYRIHPYRVKTIGYEELLMGLTREDLVKYFQEKYVPENMSLTIAGDFQREKILPLVEERFKLLKRRPFLASVVPQEPKILQSRRGELFKNVQLTRLILGFQIPHFSHPDMILLDVLAMIAGDGTQSRLYQKLQDQLKLTRSISVSTTSFLDPGMFIVSALLPDDNLSEVERVIAEELEHLRKTLASSEELERAKKRILSDFYRQLDSVDRQAFWIGMMSFLTGAPDYVSHYLKRLETVSAEDILRVAQKYLLSEQKIVCALRPSERKPQGKDESSQKTETKISKKLLANGTLLVIGEDHSIPLVTLQAIFKGGVIAEEEKNNGVFQLMASTAIRGTRLKKSQDIFGPIEALGGDLSAYADQNTFGFSIMVPREAFKNAFDILIEILQEPSFPEEEIDKQKEQCLAAIQTVEESPMSWGFLQLKKELFSGHPYRLLAYGSKGSLHNISRDDVVKIFRQFCKSNNLVLSIFGDIQSESIFDHVQSAVQSLPQGSPLSFSSHESRLKGPIHLHQLRKQEQSLIIFGFPGVTVMDADRYAFEVLATMFSGFSSPLFKKIRNEMGAAYYVGAFNLFGLDPGAFIIYAGTTVEKEDQVFESIRKTLENVRQGQIDSDDLLRSKNQLIGEKSRSLQTLTGRAREAALLELYGLGIEELDVYEQKIRSVTKEDLIRVVRKYFDEKSQVTLVVSPEATSKKES